VVKDVIVVGAGIIGATIALALRREGRKVTLLDRGETMAGTIASGGHLKPSWFGSLKKKDYEPAMELLDDVWGLIEEKFAIKLGIGTTVYRVDTDKVLALKKTVADVTKIRVSGKCPTVTLSSGKVLECKLLIVATGVWANELCPSVTTKAKQGVSFRFRGGLPEPFIKPWAPYKQIVAHQQNSKEIWIGDGTAIYPKNWTIERENQSLLRCKKALKTDKEYKALYRCLYGLRPYITECKDPCLVKKVNKKVWIVTGAGKLGTIAAGWAARRIIDATS
jgi:glycine/D-amino acid oxidase-like deaminating enzyme